MAVNPIQFLVAQNASITDGTKTITISGNVDCSRVYSGTAIFLGGADNPAEAVAGTSPDGSGNSTITLRNNWSQGDIVNQQLVSFNTNEGLAEAISNVREIVSNVSAIEDLATQGLIKRISDNEYEVVSISALGESLVGASDASSARTSLGLGSAATKNVGINAGEVLGLSAGGSLGVGENTPLSKIHAKSVGSDATVRIESTSNSGGQTRYINTLSDFSVGITGGTNGDFLIYDNTNSLTMAEYSNAAGWDFRTGGIERLTVTETGKVGINKASPQYMLHVKESEVALGNAGVLRLEKLNTGDFHILDIEVDNSENVVRYRSTGTTNGDHRFGHATQDLLTIKPTGNVGVGTTSPSAKLEVMGDIKSSGNIVFHQGNSVNPLNHGVGNTVQALYPSSSIDDNTVKAGHYRVDTTITGNKPLDQIGTVTVVRYNAGECSQIFIGPYGDSFTRFYSLGQGGWGAWRENYHSGNANFNEFGGSGTGDILCPSLGYASTSSSIVFTLPINSKTVATGITTTGTFRLYNVRTGTYEETGLTARFNGGGVSSNRVAFIDFIGLAGKTVGDLYLLASDTTQASKITVNF